MLGLVKRVKDFVRGNRLRSRAALDATPKSTLDLCAILQRQGRLAAAQQVAREGLRRFPHSLELQDALHLLWKRMGRKQLEVLEAAVRERPSVATHAELVQFQLDGQDIDGAHRSVLEFQAAFPDSSEASCLRGRIHSARFHRDHVAEDGAAAIRSFQRALELRPDDTEVEFSLAETYYYIGVVSKALIHLYRVLDRDPNHRAAHRLQRVLVKLPIERAEEAELLREAEENDDAHFRYVPDYSKTTSQLAIGVATSVMREVARLSKIVGVRRVAYASRGQEVLAQGGSLPEARPDRREPFLELASGFRRTASLSAKRMGIGAFEEAELTWKEGRLLAVAAGPSIVLLETEPAAKTSMIASEARHFIASRVPTGGKSRG